MTDTTAKLASAGQARIEEASDRAHDYLERATQAASSGMDRMAERARKGVDSAAESAKAGVEWASVKASSMRDRNAAIRNAVVDSVAARPLVAIGVAVAVGYLLGRILHSDD